MEAALVALIAVAGTIFGSVATYVLQRRQLTWRDEVEAAERLRDLHLTAYTTFAEAVAQLRGAHIQRWLAGDKHGKGGAEYAAAKTEAFRVQVLARGAMFRVQLISQDPEINRLASEIVDHAFAIHSAESREDLSVRTEKARQSQNAFVAAAALRIATLSLRGATGAGKSQPKRG